MYVYLGQVLSAWIRQQEQQPEKVPAIVPLVLYNGPGRWTAPRELLEVVDLPPDLLAASRDHLPRLRYVLHDLWREDDAQLRGPATSALAALVLLSLKYAQGARDLVKHLREWADLLVATYNQPGGKEALEFLMTYYLVVNKEASTEGLQQGLEAAFGDSNQQVAETIMPTGQQLIEQGRLQERREMLRELLDTKFGPLPDDAISRLQAAAGDEIRRWLKRLLSATSLDEVFEAP